MEFSIISSTEESVTDRQERISWWDQTKINEAKILVVGAGAVGNETIKNLCLLGVGYIFIVDFDIIERSNLSRTVLFNKSDLGKNKAEVAAIKSKEIAVNENFKVDYYHGNLVTDIGQNFFSQFDVVLGCLDNIECRIKVNKCCYQVGVPWIDVGIRELLVQCNVFDGITAPCYECHLSDQQRQNANARMSCLIGKKRAVSEGKVPTVQVSSALAGALQCQEAMKGLCQGKWLHSKEIEFNGAHDEYDIHNTRANKSCNVHHKVKFQELDLDETSSVKELFQAIQSFDITPKTFFLGETVSFVLNRVSEITGINLVVEKPNHSIFEDEILQGQIEAGIPKNEPVRTEYLDAILYGDSEWDDTKLYELGIPSGSIISVDDIDDNYHQFALACRPELKTS